MTNRITGKKSNEKGFTLAELLIAMTLMVIIAAAAVDITMRTVTVMMTGTSQNVAQSSVEQVVNAMAEDIRNAGSLDGYHIKSGSHGTSIVFTRYGINLDAFGGATPDDTEFDHACYRFQGPSGTDPYDASYVPGYIEGGSGPGKSNPGCQHYYRLTDSFADIRDFQIQYCRPSGNSPGEYTCNTDAIDNSGLSFTPPDKPDYTDTTTCVWLIKISVKYSRRLIPIGPTVNPDYYENVTYTYQTAVSPRNIYTMSIMSDADREGTIDCCQADYREDVPWCPDPASY